MRRSIILTILLLACTVGLWATEVPTVTLSQAQQSAASHNIGLSIAQLQLEGTMRTQHSLASTYMPSISLSGNLSTGGSIISGTSSGINTGASVGVSFTFTGAMITDSATRSLTEQQATLTYQGVFNTLQNTVAAQYWNIAALQNAVQASTITANSAREQYQLAQQMYDQGQVPQLSVAQAKSSADDAQQTLMQLQDSLELARSNFVDLTGIDDGEFTLEQLPHFMALELPTAQELLSAYGNSTTTMQQFSNALALAQTASATTVYSNRIPTISVSASYGISGSLTSSQGVSDSGTVSLSVNVPLSSYIPGTTANLKISDAQDAVTKATYELESGRRTLLQSIQSASIKISQYQRSYAQLCENLQTASYTYTLSQEAYEAGLLSNQELESSRNAVLNTQLSVISTRLDHLLACMGLAEILEIDLAQLQQAYPNTNA